MSPELKKRWITAIVAIAVVAFSLFGRASVYLYLLCLFVGLVGVWEAGRLLALSVDDVVVASVSLALGLLSGTAPKFPLFTIAIFLPLFYQALKLWTDREIRLDAVFPVVYLAAPLSVALYAKSLHMEWLLVAAAVSVWAGDAAAYFVGKAVGKRKLHPVSPKKTVEGAIGGLLIGGILSAITALLFLKWGFLKAVGFGFATNVAGQMGDLFESYLKRKAGVKDSGTLFPGHGGALDRIDSLLFALMVAALFI